MNKMFISKDSENGMGSEHFHSNSVLFASFSKWRVLSLQFRQTLKVILKSESGSNLDAPQLKSG